MPKMRDTFFMAIDLSIFIDSGLRTQEADFLDK